MLEVRSFAPNKLQISHRVQISDHDAMRWEHNASKIEEFAEKTVKEILPQATQVSIVYTTANRQSNKYESLLRVALPQMTEVETEKIKKAHVKILTYVNSCEHEECKSQAEECESQAKQMPNQPVNAVAIAIPVDVIMFAWNFLSHIVQDIKKHENEDI